MPIIIIPWNIRFGTLSISYDGYCKTCHNFCVFRELKLKTSAGSASKGMDKRV